jgi:hypothetical protein
MVRSGGRSRRSRAGHGRRGVSKRGGAPRPKDQLQLDFELDLLNAERDGRDIEQIKIEYREKREAQRKEKLDKEMDSYFDEQKDKTAEAGGASGSGGASGAGAEADIGVSSVSGAADSGRRADEGSVPGS